MSAAPLITGAKYMYQNLGKVNNHGFEFEAENGEIELVISTMASKAILRRFPTKWRNIKEKVCIIWRNSTPKWYPSILFWKGYPFVVSAWLSSGSHWCHYRCSRYKDNNHDNTITDGDRVQMARAFPISLMVSPWRLHIKISTDGLWFWRTGIDLMYGVSSSSEGGLQSTSHSSCLMTLDHHEHQCQICGARLPDRWQISWFWRIHIQRFLF